MSRSAQTLLVSTVLIGLLSGCGSEREVGPREERAGAIVTRIQETQGILSEAVPAARPHLVRHANGVPCRGILEIDLSRMVARRPRHVTVLPALGGTGGPRLRIEAEVSKPSGSWVPVGRLELPLRVDLGFRVVGSPDWDVPVCLRIGDFAPPGVGERSGGELRILLNKVGGGDGRIGAYHLHVDVSWVHGGVEWLRLPRRSWDPSWLPDRPYGLKIELDPIGGDLCELGVRLVDAVTRQELGSCRERIPRSSLPSAATSWSFGTAPHEMRKAPGSCIVVVDELSIDPAPVLDGAETPERQLEAWCRPLGLDPIRRPEPDSPLESWLRYATAVLIADGAAAPRPGDALRDMLASFPDAGSPHAVCRDPSGAWLVELARHLAEVAGEHWDRRTHALSDEDLGRQILALAARLGGELGRPLEALARVVANE